MQKAVSSGNLEEFKRLETHSTTTESLLHTAVNEGQNKIVEYLVSKGKLKLVNNDIGANVNARDANGKTPLVIALEKGHKEIAEYLTKATKNNK